MAFLDDMLKGNVVTALAVGVGGTLLAPLLAPAVTNILRPAAKAVIKGGILAYDKGRQAAAQVGEATSDIAAGHAVVNRPNRQVLLERGVAALPGVLAAAASLDTGNLLVLFDPALPPGRITQRVAALLRGEAARGDGPAAAGQAMEDGPRWHARSAAEACAALDVSPERGLTAEAARVRLAETGANTLPTPPARSAFGTFVGQFQSLPVGLLAAAAAVSVVTGGLFEAVAIGGVVAFNGVLGFVIERRSERTIRSLGNTDPAPVRVLRDGKDVDIPPEAVVPGDVLTLLPGDLVPADARLLSARELTVGEAMLTGESRPARKHAGALPRAAVREAPLGDRANMVYRGTAVTGGSGAAVVVATGGRTEMGRIQALVSREAAPQTPMQRQLDTLGTQLVWASLAACGAVVGVGALRGLAVAQLLRSGISLAVAAIPEGLPTVATTTLALGIEDMRRRKVLVRRLDAVETLASVNVACFDKTGTLTENRMRVAHVALSGGALAADEHGVLRDGAGHPARLDDPDLERLLRVAVLCSEAEIETGPDGRPAPSGSATESALVQMALDAGLDAEDLRRSRPRLATRHRSEAYRFMATAHALPDGPVRVAVKGNPAEVLALCGTEMRGRQAVPLSDARRAALLRDNEAMADAALRVLGFAFCDAAPDEVAEDAIPVHDLTWLGLAGMADPVRPGIAALVGTLRAAGIHAVMMTGDQVPTARAVARQLGLAGGGEIEVVDIGDYAGLPPERLAAAARRAHVFARVSPAQKLQVVRALQHAGAVVAMCGDGINDSPALKAADVGVAMGGDAASEAAREVADVVLQTNDLAALAVAVERGRTTYTNVRKSIRYLLATNLSEILMVLGATAAGFGAPLTALQLLWINLVSDVLPGLGLAFEPPEPDAMARGPRPADGSILGRGDRLPLLAEGGVIAAGALAAGAFGTLRHGASAQARTMVFGSLVTSQLLHALTCRSVMHGPFTGGDALRPNRALAGTLLFSFAAQGAALCFPGVRGLLGVVPLGAADLLATAAGGVLPYLLNEARKGQPGLITVEGTAMPALLPPVPA